MKSINLLLSIALTANSQAQNYDEAKVPSYTLPDALVSLNGKRITTKKQWETIRRPEVLRLFADNMYGQIPKTYSAIKFTLTNEDKAAMGGKAHLKQVQIEVTQGEKSIRINLILFIPNQVTGPAPAFMLINHRGKDNTDPTRTVKSDFWPAELLIAEGLHWSAKITSSAWAARKATGWVRWPIT